MFTDGEASELYPVVDTDVADAIGRVTLMRSTVAPDWAWSLAIGTTSGRRVFRF